MLSRLFHTTVRKIENISHTSSKFIKRWPESWTTIHYKEYPRFPELLLSKDNLPLGQLEESLRSRRSERIFDMSTNLSLTELSTLLKFSAGINNSQEQKSNQEHNNAKRHYPSGGSRYPLEVYISVNRVKELEGGVYHYNIKNHSLEKILNQTNSEEIKKTITYSWARDAAVMFIITAVQSRNYVKYGDFGYDILATESGHMSQNLHLVASALKRKFCPLVGFKNDSIKKILDLDDDELVLYLTAMG